MQADPAEAPPIPSEADAPPRGLIIAAVALTVAAIAAVLAVAASHRTPTAPVAITAVPAPQAEAPECQALLSTLPDRLGDYARADTAQPTPAGTAAWRAGDGGEPVVMRCGLNRPAEFVVGAPIQLVDEVAWFRLEDPQSPLATWLCVDRPVYIALTLPTGSGPAPIQAMSDVIDRTMPAIPIRPAPAG